MSVFYRDCQVLADSSEYFDFYYWYSLCRNWQLIVTRSIFGIRLDRSQRKWNKRSSWWISNQGRNKFRGRCIFSFRRRTWCWRRIVYDFSELTWILCSFKAIKRIIDGLCVFDNDTYLGLDPGYTFNGSIPSTIRNQHYYLLNSTLVHYEDDEDVRMTWNAKMKSLDCCGVNGFNKDFSSLKNKDAQNSVKMYCCNPKIVRTCNKLNFTELNNGNTKPSCSNKAFKKFKDHYYVDIIAVGFLIITNGLAITAAFGIKKEEKGEDGDEYEYEMSIPEPANNSVSNLPQMRNTSAAQSAPCRDSEFMYENF